MHGNEEPQLDREFDVDEESRTDRNRRSGGRGSRRSRGDGVGDDAAGGAVGGGLPSWYADVNADGDPAYADFEAHVPCSIDPEPDPACQRVKFGLVLYRDAQTLEPTSYAMSIIRVGVSDEREAHEGGLRVESGTALHPDDPVYRLDGVPDHLRDYWVVGEDMLLMLDAERMPRVGDAGYSFTLNRVPLRIGE